MTKLDEDVVTTTIQLLGKVYHIRCSKQEAMSLERSATYLNDSLTAMKLTTKDGQPERLAIVAALNMASKVLELEEQLQEGEARMQAKLAYLCDAMDEVLHDRQ